MCTAVATPIISFPAAAYRPTKKAKIAKKTEKDSSVNLSFGTAEETWFID